LEERLQRLQAHLAEERQRQAVAEEAASKAEHSYEQARARLQQQNAEVEAIRGQYRAAEEALRNHQRQLAEARAHLERAAAQRAALQERAAALATEREQNQGTIAALEAELEAHSLELARLTGAVQDIRTQLHAAEEKVAFLRHAHQELRAQQFRTQAEIERARDRAEILRRLLESHEDQPASVRLLLTESPQDFQALGTLADVLAVDEQYRQAVEAALGEALNYLVVCDRTMAFRGIALLQSQEHGAAWFVPLADLRLLPVRERTLPGDEVLGWVDELVQCDDAYRPLVAALLGSTAVVKDMDAACRLHAAAAAQGWDLVTLNGERLTAAGLVRGGGSARQEVGLLGRRQQLDQVTNLLNTLSATLEELARQEHEQAAEITSRAQEEQQLRNLLQTREQELAEYQLRLGHLDARLRTLRERQQVIAAEESQVGERLALAQQELDRLSGHLEQLTAQGEELSAQAEHLRQRLLQIEPVAAELAAETERLHVALIGHKRDLDEVLVELSRTEALISETQQAITSRNEQARQARAEAATLSERIAQLKRDLQDGFAKREQLEHQVLELEERYRAHKQQIEAQERSCREVRTQRERVAEAVHKLELEVNELQLKINNLKERARVEFEVELTPQEIEDFNVQAVEQEIATLRQKLKLLGPVNLLALREYEQEKARLDLMLSQRKDLLDARANLEETIRRINQTAREKFAEVFDTVNQNFRQVFAEFFEGGVAEIRLEEGEDPLEAEIKIVASPKGKRMESLSLLSGGEKALTAISLLFAIYLVKPSPFCILDEVDAPLDDINVHRFVQALRKFSSNTQFITVTHNKITMKAADYLYGVAMGEDQISRLVSVRFGEQDSAPEPRDAAVA
jgi:chromosome segregation protein